MTAAGRETSGGPTWLRRRAGENRQNRSLDRAEHRPQRGEKRVKMRERVESSTKIGIAQRGHHSSRLQYVRCSHQAEVMPAAIGKLEIAISLGTAPTLVASLWNVGVVVILVHRSDSFSCINHGHAQFAGAVYEPVIPS